MKNNQHNPLNGSELFRPLCSYFMLTNALFSVYLSINSEYYLFLSLIHISPEDID